MKAGMQALHFMVGDWAIQAHNMSAESEWIPSALPRETTIKSVFEGVFLQEDEVSIMAGDTVMRFFIMWSYDAHRETYRMLACDDQEGLADVLEGNFEADTDTITVSNLNTGTHRLDEQGNPVYLRLISTKNNENSFNDEIQESADGGQTWHSVYRAAHTRKI